MNRATDSIRKSCLLTFVILMTTLCGLNNSQNVSLPSDKEVTEYLKSPARVKTFVDCIIKFKPTCDSRLKRVFELAPSYLATGGKCSCTKEELRWVRMLQVRLQKQYSTEYRRLLRSVTS